MRSNCHGDGTGAADPDVLVAGTINPTHTANEATAIDLFTTSNGTGATWALSVVAIREECDYFFEIFFCIAAIRSANQGWRVLHNCGSSSLATASG